jgi:hypothetical protein
MIRCKAMTENGTQSCIREATKLVSVLKQEYPMCANHAALTRKQFSKSETQLVRIQVSVSELPKDWKPAEKPAEGGVLSVGRNDQKPVDGSAKVLVAKAS